VTAPERSVPTNLRISLTILSIGFAIEGAWELYSVLSGGTFRPGTWLLLIIPTIATLVGLLFVWIGRHEWNELHHDRVRRAHVVFGLSLVGGFVGGGILVLLIAVPTLGVPAWASVVFGASIGSLVFGTFVTYGILVFHLVRPVSQGILIASLLWSLLISALVARVLVGDLPTLVGLVAHRPLDANGLVDPISSLASFLFVSYFLLLATYVDAHRTVTKGIETSSTGPAPTSGASR
jgi:hypothetical protein